MRLARLLFTPKWQDKDAAVRRSAVATDSDVGLLAALPELVRTDPDAGVRVAALKRLNEYECWRERSTGDADESVRRSARAAYLALLCANAAGAPPLSRQIAELDTLGSEEIEKVATTAIHRQLREAALTYVTKPGLLAERAIADPDPQLRQQILDRIDDAGLLERIAERARKTDKAVSRRARERLEALRISAGDVTAIADKARTLCERAEALMRTPHAAIESELAGIDNAWAALGATAPADLSARYRGARALALRAREMLQHSQLQQAQLLQPQLQQAQLLQPQLPQTEAATAEPSPTLPPAAHVETPVLPAAVHALAAQVRFDAAVAATQAEARIEREQRQTRQREIEELLAQFAAAIDAGDSANAHRLHASIHEAMLSLRDVPASLQKQLSPVQARYAEIQRWQHWSNNQRRRVLCVDIEAVVGSGLHPDALATKVRDAREEWQRLETAEGTVADAAPVDGLARHFHALCQRALRPTKVYFSKLKEVRKSHGEEIDALLARAVAIGDDSTDWNALVALRQEVSAALRSLDGVDPRTRTTLAKRLKETIARLGALTDAHEREIETSRQRLIEQAMALAERGDRATLPREARELQKHWTALGSGRRATDQRQWREFRAACDNAFGRLDAERKQHEAEAAGVRAQAAEMLGELEALAADEVLSADAIKTKLRELDMRWQAVALEDRGFVQRQRQARDAIALRLKDAARRNRLARYSLAMDKYTMLRSAETGTPLPDGRWQECAASVPEFDLPLAARYARAREFAADAVHVESEAAHESLMRLEFLAGIESPAEDRQRRMNHQVQRLSSRMRDGAAASPERELTDLLAAWFRLAPQPQPLETRFERAAMLAIDALP